MSWAICTIVEISAHFPVSRASSSRRVGLAALAGNELGQFFSQQLNQHLQAGSWDQ